MTLIHIAILLVSLAGFAALALATERHAEHLLRRVPAPQWRLLARVVGWVLLAIALALGIVYMGTGLGITLWLGWLSIAALALVFAFPKWPWQPKERVKPARPAKAGAAAPALPPAPPRARRWIAAALLVAVPVVFLLTLKSTPIAPLLRADAVAGQVGPWSFRLAESNRNVPDLVAMDIPMKSYQVRFCEDCDAQIRAAYLKVNKPRSLRAAGIVLNGARWNRSVDIQLPANTTPDSILWLTVVGKDGEMHQAQVRLADVSPATVAWFKQREDKPQAGREAPQQAQ
ncbi:DUF3325 domain-containing protein [Acidovorax sp. CCYZU-2555]|uniref:DUF3325 domain-containing protein n=1 Tax=Acidovorax sp. CCYZU-2555 TaxID=2835042 RepID=UPI001BCB0249|nr:DUF3325 domain-containing protein [Acidovorax sp. CCYZU-2555]MBS7780497.1 DUF3325 domain-containing protein [Acidovorax sp. CCYZU-2555]